MILVTGGTGFVGQHLQEELARRGVPCAIFSSADYDLTVREQADAVFARYRDADLVVHLACYQAAGEFPARHPAEQFQINNLIHVNVLEAWRRHAPQARFIGAGSSCAYPSDLLSLTEDRLMDGAIHGSVYSYAFTKRALCTGLAAYNDQFKLNGSYVIPPTLFGEYDDFHVDTAHVVGALVGKFVRAVREGQPEVEIWGDGSQVREFLYVKDFVTALLDLAPQLEREVLNVAPGRGTSIRTLATEIGEAAGFTGRIDYNASRYVGVKEKFLNTTRLEERYGLRIDPSIAAGIRRTVAWYAAHYDEVKDRRKFDARTPVAAAIS
jgi:GDP-L-fucose synthase